MSIRAVILDLDMTMVDTACLEPYRKARKWTNCYLKIPNSQAYTGISEFLEFCESAGIQVGVVTTSPSPYATRVLNHHGFKVHNLVAFHDAAPKPNPAGMKLCASRMGVEPEECLCIGDLPKDIEAGKAAGMVTVAAMWGCADKERLLAVAPDHIIQTPAALQNLLAE